MRRSEADVRSVWQSHWPTRAHHVSGRSAHGAGKADWRRIGPKHLQVYLDEMTVRFDRRSRFDLILDTLRQWLPLTLELANLRKTKPSLSVTS